MRRARRSSNRSGAGPAVPCLVLCLAALPVAAQDGPARIRTAQMPGPYGTTPPPFPPGYNPQGGSPAYGGQPGYGNQPGYGEQPGYDPQSGTGGQPGYGARPGYGGQPGPAYGQGPGPTYGGQPYGGPAYGGTPGGPQPSEQVQLPPGVDGDRLRAVAMQERQDFGVPPTSELHAGAPHGPTPTSIPRGRVIDTLNLVALLSHQPPVPVVFVDALGGSSRIGNAVPAAWAAQAGGFGDGIDTNLRGTLQRATGGDPTRPIVVYCSDPNCWMSYNVALRLINLGFQNVFWYRGGLAAWQGAGLPLQQGKGR